MHGRRRTIARVTIGIRIPAFRRSRPASGRTAERRSHPRDMATIHRAAPACGGHSAQYSGSRRIRSIVIAGASPSRMIGSATATSGGNGTSSRGATGSDAATARVVDDPGKPAAVAVRATAGCATPRHAPKGGRTIGVSIEDESREALRAPLPRRPRAMKPCRLLASAGIRAGGVPALLPARITRSGPRPRATCTRNAPEPTCVVRRGRLPLRGQRRLAISMRSAPCFPFNRATHARAPRRRQFRSGSRERQESGRTYAGSAPRTRRSREFAARSRGVTTGNVTDVGMRVIPR